MERLRRLEIFGLWGVETRISYSLISYTLNTQNPQYQTLDLAENPARWPASFMLWEPSSKKTYVCPGSITLGKKPGDPTCTLRFRLEGFGAVGHQKALGGQVAIGFCKV